MNREEKNKIFNENKNFNENKMLNETLECCCRALLQQRSILPYCGTAADWIGILNDSGRPLSACDGYFSELNNKQNKILNEILWYFIFTHHPSTCKARGRKRTIVTARTKQLNESKTEMLPIYI